MKQGDVMRLAIILAILLAFAIPDAAWAATPPEPEPPPPADPWDKSSITVTGACVQDQPIFTITNVGSGDMAAPSSFWFLNVDGGAVDCSADIASAIGSGTFQLASGDAVQVVFPKGDLDPPYRLCVAQRDGHPGTGWGSSTIGQDDVCVTAEQEVAEPVAGYARLFVPLVTR